MEAFRAFITEPSTISTASAIISALGLIAVRVMQMRVKQRAAERAVERESQRALENELRARITGLETEIRALREQLQEWQERYLEAIGATARLRKVA